MKSLLIVLSAGEFLSSAILFVMCLTSHKHSENFFQSVRVKLAMCIVASLTMTVGLLYYGIHNISGFLVDFLVFYLLHSCYLEDFEPKRTYNHDE